MGNLFETIILGVLALVGGFLSFLLVYSIMNWIDRKMEEK